jgi:tetratricopeptide (TPR) repeat protein
MNIEHQDTVGHREDAVARMKVFLPQARLWNLVDDFQYFFEPDLVPFRTYIQRRRCNAERVLVTPVLGKRCIRAFDCFEDIAAMPHVAGIAPGRTLYVAQHDTIWLGPQGDVRERGLFLADSEWSRQYSGTRQAFLECGLEVGKAYEVSKVLVPDKVVCLEGVAGAYYAALFTAEIPRNRSIPPWQLSASEKQDREEAEFICRAHRMLAHGEYASAREIGRRLVERGNVEGFDIVSTAYLREGQPDKAIELLREALPESKFPWVLHGILYEVYMQLGRIDEALAEHAAASPDIWRKWNKTGKSPFGE